MTQEYASSGTLFGNLKRKDMGGYPGADGTTSAPATNSGYGNGNAAQPARKRRRQKDAVLGATDDANTASAQVSGA